MGRAVPQLQPPAVLPIPGNTNINITSTTSNSTVAELLDSGNLILQGDDVIWQSFDHPTNCWLPGGRLGLNRLTGENVFITSWKSPDDPAMGDYSFRVDPTRDQLVQLYKGVQQYWTSGEWNGQYFSLVPELTRNQFYNFSYSNSSKYITYSILDPSIVTHFTVDVSGQGKMWWLKSATESILVWLQPRDQCDIYYYCGAFGVCSQNTLDSCACLRGFKPMSTREWGLGIWNGGCLRTSALQCAKNGSGGGGGDGHRRINSGALVGAIIGCVAVIILIAFFIWKLRCTKRTLELSENSLSTFMYRDLEHVTKNFSETLGKGGFGSVYKGAFSDSTVVAVKKLEGFSQGEKQFRTEILAMGLKQHVNLVRLRGFCCQGSTRLLVYDYMPNGSLETHLFKNPSNRLDWKTRYLCK
ncbi:G-type lectin S-receptor-like serine/threonine-protein kinase [Acorus gramineus]|uniref:G-type lectin S-receptor-like serine/threonine-protein kinase n=1 Tax=Acorus gramineus TaxID=55184 RepID=A0AAV9AAG0_ACOGR|nr:G-type lectin S-receptor-like serine/threonine-protein kinase [Acorus gramineus]